MQVWEGSVLVVGLSVVRAQRKEFQVFSLRSKSLAIIATALTAGGIALTAGTSGTGAFFSDTKAGVISGSVGSIKVATTEGTLKFTNLLPGDAQTVSSQFKNTGLSTQDVYLVFPNADALHALNDLGTYGEVHINVSGTQVFDSANLNDGYPCGTPGLNGAATLCAVPKTIKLIAGLTPGGIGDLNFKFNYAGKLSTQSPAGGGVWNAYPLGAPTENGLPYQIVAVQQGQTP